MNAILTMSSFIFPLIILSVCFKDSSAGRNRNGFICNIGGDLFCIICTAGHSDLRDQGLCKGEG